MDLNKMPLHILRQRLGLEDDDDSKDGIIAKYSPEKIVRELSAWHLGDPRWAESFAYWMKKYGAKPENF